MSSVRTERSWLFVIVGLALLGAIITITFTGGYSALRGFARSLVYASAIMGIILVGSFVFQGVHKTIRSRTIQLLIVAIGIGIFVLGESFQLPALQVYPLAALPTGSSQGVNWILLLVGLLIALVYYNRQTIR